MAERTVVRSIKNIADLSVAEVENAVEYLLFVDNEKLFPMAEYTKLQPIVVDIAKLVMLYADQAAEQMQREVLLNVSRHLQEEVTKVVYSAKVPTLETLVVTEPEPEEVPVEPENDW